MKRLQIDVFVEDSDFDALSKEIDAIKTKIHEASEHMKYHDCGHLSGKKCKNEVHLWQQEMLQ